MRSQLVSPEHLCGVMGRVWANQLAPPVPERTAVPSKRRLLADLAPCVQKYGSKAPCDMWQERSKLKDCSLACKQVTDFLHTTHACRVWHGCAGFAFGDVA